MFIVSYYIPRVFYNVTSFSFRVIICKTLKKKGRAFRNIGFKYTQFSTGKSALLLFRFHDFGSLRSWRNCSRATQNFGGGAWIRAAKTRGEWEKAALPQGFALKPPMPRVGLARAMIFHQLRAWAMISEKSVFCMTFRIHIPSKIIIVKYG